jgi:hypothetical protein
MKDEQVRRSIGTALKSATKRGDTDRAQELVDQRRARRETPDKVGVTTTREARRKIENRNEAQEGAARGGKWNFRGRSIPKPDLGAAYDRMKSR